MSDMITGGCLCGAVRFEVNADPMMPGHCHCTDCRKSSGTGHASLFAAPKAAVTITGALESYDKPADSGNVVTRSFCPNCGSWIHSQNDAMPELMFMVASGLDDLERFRPQLAVFRRSVPSWDHADPALASFEAMPEGGSNAAQ